MDAHLIENPTNELLKHEQNRPLYRAQLFSCFRIDLQFEKNVNENGKKSATNKNLININENE